MATVRLIVRDVALASRFYVEHLGFEPEKEWSDAFAELSRGDLALWLAGPRSSAGAALADGTVPSPGGWGRIVLEVEDLAATVARLEAAGVRFRVAPLKGPGGTQALIEDPSGNPVELFEKRRG